MRNKGDEQFYRKLSRKELQGLCKKYGLPARKSSSEMAKLLASYFENMCSKTTGDPLMITGPLHGAPFCSSVVAGTDNNGFHSKSREEGKIGRFSHTVRSNELDRCIEDKAYDKEGVGCSMLFQDLSNSPFPFQCDRSNFNSKECPTTKMCENCSGIVGDGRVENMCGIQHTDLNHCQCPRENSLSSSSLEFYVRSEEGIKLCVDLSSNPSDWINKLKNEVNICENTSHNKAPSFHQELGRLGESNNQNKSSFLRNVDARQSKDGNVQSESSPSILTKENKDVVLNHPEGGDGSLTSIAIKPSGLAVVLSEHVQEDQGVVSSEPNSDARDGIHSCTDDNGCVTTIESDVISPRKELAGNSTVDTSDCPISLASFEYQKPSNENCEYSNQENSCNLVNSQLAIAGCAASSSGGVPPSETEIQQNGLSIPHKNGEFLDSVLPGNTETEQSGFANSSEPDLDICGTILPTPAEELERSKLIDGGEGSESSQFDDSLEKTCSSLDNMESDKELLKKRPRIENNDQADHSRPDAKILRSIKNMATKVLRRRSMRLVSK